MAPKINKEDWAKKQAEIVEAKLGNLSIGQIKVHFNARGTCLYTMDELTRKLGLGMADRVALTQKLVAMKLTPPKR